MESLPPHILKIQYSSLGDEPFQRLQRLRLVHRLIQKPEGLYTRTRMHMSPDAWRQLTSWVKRVAPMYLRVEEDAVRILKKYSGHMLIGTATLIEDLDEVLETVNEPPTLNEIWAAASRASSV